MGSSPSPRIATAPSVARSPKCTRQATRRGLSILPVSQSTGAHLVSTLAFSDEGLGNWEELPSRKRLVLGPLRWGRWGSRGWRYAPRLAACYPSPRFGSLLRSEGFHRERVKQ
jgi:hypothetical protein